MINVNYRHKRCSKKIHKRCLNRHIHTRNTQETQNRSTQNASKTHNKHTQNTHERTHPHAQDMANRLEQTLYKESKSLVSISLRVHVYTRTHPGSHPSTHTHTWRCNRKFCLTRIHMQSSLARCRIQCTRGAILCIAVMLTQVSSSWSPLGRAPR